MLWLNTDYPLRHNLLVTVNSKDFVFLYLTYRNDLKLIFVTLKCLPLLVATNPKAMKTHRMMTIFMMSVVSFFLTIFQQFAESLPSEDLQDSNQYLYLMALSRVYNDKQSNYTMTRVSVPD